MGIMCTTKLNAMTRKEIILKNKYQPNYTKPNQTKPIEQFYLAHRGDLNKYYHWVRVELEGMAIIGY